MTFRAFYVRAKQFIHASVEKAIDCLRLCYFIFFVEPCLVNVMFLFCGKLLENIKTSFCRRYRLISARFRQTQRRPLGLYRFYKFLCIFCGWMEKKMKMNSVSRILRDTYHLTPCTRERMFLLWRFRLVFRQFSVIRQRNEMMKKCYVLRRACASDHRFIWKFFRKFKWEALKGIQRKQSCAHQSVPSLDYTTD